MNLRIHGAHNSPIDVGEGRAPRRVYGLPIPQKVHTIDEHGYESTKHALRFRGNDWDIALNTRREEITLAFVQEAAAATGEPKTNIQNARYAVDEKNRLVVRFDVRHKAQTSSSVVQDRLATYPFKGVTQLYEPRTKNTRPSGLQKQTSGVTSSLALSRRLHPTLSSFGHAAAAVGPNGPEFRDEREEEEPLEAEPEKPQNAQILPILA
ncbi:hypothetical protein DQ04_12601020 [Trypanosoma grayi]|uniref:hypothetical protein n=1 Tax=Trypanosoma grayi TaxID=71804 RepID=UPI0004F3FF36|nr:hypothetical protein DQ04_12601020 [Trypanosoma grayi]KEG06715.1 hypothetical protein DQ04_12601020 [Trypanosoma grayi]